MKLEIPKSPTFQTDYIPSGASLVGTAALVQALQVDAPVRQPCCVVAQRFGKERTKQIVQWTVFDSRYALSDDLEEHLLFALKHENIDLLVLKRILLAIAPKTIEEIVSKSPTGPVSRRLWFLFEFLTGNTLSLSDVEGRPAAVDVLDSEKYFTVPGELSRRHRVRNNLLGGIGFCPIIRRTKLLTEMSALDLSSRAKQLVKHTSPQLVARAASFLLLADSQASFAIEGERLPVNEEERWLRAVQQVGKHPVTFEELDRLHEILIKDRRFVGQGFRKDGVFLGTHTYDGRPIPEFIGARPDDLQNLMSALLQTNERMTQSQIDPVAQAAATAFGFIYIHPYSDGNGRLHRCLIHHVLNERKFSPDGMIFPVSSVIEKRIVEYREVLRGHSSKLMPYIEWHPTDSGNVDVVNDTADLYRYFDCTEAAEFLYSCVKETVEHDVPDELRYLAQHDEAIAEITSRVEMPNQLARSFILFMRQNNWTLPKKRREREFAKLTDEEVDELTQIVREAFAVNEETDESAQFR